MKKLNKMENTRENRSKFFNLYHRQHINSSRGICCLRDADFIDSVEWIELKSISLITDEDAKKLGFIDSDHFKIDANEYGRKDELRLLCYAIEWAGLSVEDQIKYGWIKLIE